MSLKSLLTMCSKDELVAHNLDQAGPAMSPEELARIMQPLHDRLVAGPASDVLRLVKIVVGLAMEDLASRLILGNRLVRERGLAAPASTDMEAMRIAFDAVADAQADSARVALQQLQQRGLIPTVPRKES